MKGKEFCQSLIVNDLAVQQPPTLWIHLPMCFVLGRERHAGITRRPWRKGRTWGEHHCEYDVASIGPSLHRSLFTPDRTVATSQSLSQIQKEHIGVVILKYI